MKLFSNRQYYLSPFIYICRLSSEKDASNGPSQKLDKISGMNKE
jgi:hypothetical protein